MTGKLVGITSNYMPDGENLNFAISSLDVWAVEYGAASSLADVAAALAPAPSTVPAPVGVAAAQPAYTLKPLAGVVGVFVLVEDISPAAVSDGLAEDTVDNDVQLELRRNGVPVDATNESVSQNHGYLYVQQTLVKLDSGNYAFSINLQFKETVTLTRDVPVQADAGTWNADETGYVPRDQMVATVRQTTIDLVDQFSNDYLAQNPASSSATSATTPVPAQ